MSLNLRTVLAIMCLLAFLPHRPAAAQRGQFVEGLFRTLAEARLEHERQKRIEAERRARLEAEQAQRPQPKNPYQVQLPSGFGIPPAAATPNRVPAVVQPAGKPKSSISVRSQEAAAFVGDLVKFNQQITPLVTSLRNETPNHPQLRGLMPEVYGVAADTRALLQSCDGISSLAPVMDPYRALDARWRQLSFELGAIPGFPKAVTAPIGQCDKLCSSMCGQLDIQPQFDRQALRDVMIKASTYMQALSDDLEIAVLNESHCRQLTHDLRMLRQRLLAEADQVELTTYDQMVARFNDFAAHWRAFSAEVYRIRNPHLHRRLDRIGECGEQTYHLLWLQPPVSAQELMATAVRLEEGLEAVLGQLNLRAMVQLKPQDQIRVLQSCRDLYQQSRQLHELCESNVSRDQLKTAFVKIDRGWGSISDTLPQVSSLNRGTIAEIDRACQQLRGGFGIENQYGPAASGNLLQAAAALESTAEFLNTQIRQFERNLRPNSFRESVRDATRELLHHSEGLHEALERRGRFNDDRYFSRLQSEAEQVVKAWNQLAKDFDRIEQHGMPQNQARRIRAAQAAAVPHVAEIAAALLQ